MLTWVISGESHECARSIFLFNMLVIILQEKTTFNATSYVFFCLIRECICSRLKAYTYLLSI